VIGKREVAEGKVAVRPRSGEDFGAMTPAEFLAIAQAVIASKSLELTV